MKKIIIRSFAMLVCAVLLLSSIYTLAQPTVSRYVSSVNVSETFDMHVNPEESSAFAGGCNKYTVTLYSDTGKTAVNGTAIIYVDNSLNLISVPNVTPPTSSGYAFEGYFTSAGACYYNKKGQPDNFTGLVTELYAHWSEIQN